MSDLTETDLELAILKEDYDEFSDEAHAARLHWMTDGTFAGKGDFKPVVINGRRVVPGLGGNA